MKTTPSDSKSKGRQLRKAVKKILSTVRQVAVLGEEARKAQEEFERLTAQGAADGK